LAIHRLNQGSGSSTVLKCADVGAPITPGSRVAGGLKRREDDDKYHKERAKQPEMKRRRIQTIIDNQL